MRSRFFGVAFLVSFLVGCSATGSSAEPIRDRSFQTSTPTSTATRRPTSTPVLFPTPTPVPALPFESTRIEWQGELWYLHGANVPWFNWGCDFGCGANGGVSLAEVGQAVTAAIRTAKPAGLNVIRWWMFPGEPNQFVRSDDGSPVGIRPDVYQDIDAAVGIARQQDIYFSFVLFSSPTHIPAAWTTDVVQRRKLADVIGELAEHYRNEPHIMAWEVFNEPEWDIWDGRASSGDVVATADAIADEIHLRSNALVTVGAATIEALGIWADSKLDFYSPHWYDPMAPRACARCTDYATLRATYGIEKPVVIGEFYADSTVDAAQRYTDFYAKGFAGAWSWSLFPERTADHLGVDLAAASEFGNDRFDLGPINQ